MNAETVTALGLMSGTSADGIDVAVIETDGEGVAAFGPAATIPYPDDIGPRIRALYGKKPDPDDADVRAVCRDLTDAHADAVIMVLAKSGLVGTKIDVIGFHGQTVWHAPEQRETVQLGDAQRLADETGRPVVSDFRSADVAAGGQGAPFAPLYHRALADGLDKPLGVLNLGGVGNVTVLGQGADDVVAFDTGPANALIDDWVSSRGAGAFDQGGALARAGRVDAAALAALLDNPYFDAPPPKSLDRQAFSLAPVAGLALEDGAATLAAFTAASVRRGLDHMARAPLRWLVTGGGRRNAVLMGLLAEALGVAVDPVEAVGWDGDALEAQAFAFLAVRSIRDLPLSLPSTTGVPRPTAGGRLVLPAETPFS